MQIISFVLQDSESNIHLDDGKFITVSSINLITQITIYWFTT